MTELFRHTDFGGDVLFVETDPDGDLIASVQPNSLEEETTVYLDDAAGRRLLAALQQHYARPQSDGPSIGLHEATGQHDDPTPSEAANADEGRSQ